MQTCLWMDLDPGLLCSEALLFQLVWRGVSGCWSLEMTRWRLWIRVQSCSGILCCRCRCRCFPG